MRITPSFWLNSNASYEKLHYWPLHLNFQSTFLSSNFIAISFSVLTTTVTRISLLICSIQYEISLYLCRHSQATRPKVGFSQFGLIFSLEKLRDRYETQFFFIYKCRIWKAALGFRFATVENFLLQFWKRRKANGIIRSLFSLDFCYVHIHSEIIYIA